MTGAELIADLEKTGTGRPKLAAARALLDARPDAPAAEVVEALRAAGAAEGTLGKCAKLLGVEILAPEGEAARPVFPVRAPLGGVVIAKAQYVPGQVVPPEVVARATPEEVRQLCRESNALGVQPVAPPAAPAPPPAAEAEKKAKK
jgi:hypothetical protein